jgi:glutathione S-transferase
MKLYQFSISPNAKRIRVIANELGLKLDVVSLDFTKGEHKTPEFLAKNPNGKVPTIEEDDGSTMWESPATLVYLASKHPNSNLFPNEARKRGDVTRWMFWNASHLEQAVFTLAFENMIKPMMKQEPDPARIAHGNAELDRFAPILNAQLEGKQYVCGDYSIADICIATTLEFGTAAGCDYSKYKHITAWLGRLAARDAWKKS